MEHGQLDEILDRYRDRKNPVIEVMQDIQRIEGYLPKADLAYVGERLDVSLAELFHMATFYKVFRLEPRGERFVRLCMGTACYVRGAPLLVDELKRQMGLEPGVTTADGKYTLETVGCVGACAMAPCLSVNDVVFGGVKPNEIVPIVKEGKRNGN